NRRHRPRTRDGATRERHGIDPRGSVQGAFQGREPESRHGPQGAQGTGPETDTAGRLSVTACDRISTPMAALAFSYWLSLNAAVSFSRKLLRQGGAFESHP